MLDFVIPKAAYRRTCPTEAYAPAASEEPKVEEKADEGNAVIVLTSGKFRTAETKCIINEADAKGAALAPASERKPLRRKPTRKKSRPTCAGGAEAAAPQAEVGERGCDSGALADGGEAAEAAAAAAAGPAGAVEGELQEPLRAPPRSQSPSGGGAGALGASRLGGGHSSGEAEGPSPRSARPAYDGKVPEAAAAQRSPPIAEALFNCREPAGSVALGEGRQMEAFHVPAQRNATPEIKRLGPRNTRGRKRARKASGEAGRGDDGQTEYFRFAAEEETARVFEDYKQTVLNAVKSAVDDAASLFEDASFESWNARALPQCLGKRSIGKLKCLERLDCLNSAAWLACRSHIKMRSSYRTLLGKSLLACAPVPAAARTR
ncbi:unnamed protein product [Prorocentrum cordatum]|uniref:Uncharacterized protein n=1 Tax=Prorocentrum cordatum TaxID=2364126 RepID=A0ABN9UAM6_9DINO|nr:unnamed protein product [Polarella glacialis]